MHKYCISFIVAFSLYFNIPPRSWASAVGSKVAAVVIVTLAVHILGCVMRVIVFCFFPIYSILCRSVSLSFPPTTPLPDFN